MLESAEIYTKSRHYKLQKDEFSNYATPNKITSSEAKNYYTFIGKLYYTKDGYVIEHRKSCKPVYLLMVTSIPKNLYRRLHNNMATPWSVYYNSIRRFRQSLFQEWEEHIL